MKKNEQKHDQPSPMFVLEELEKLKKKMIIVPKEKEGCKI